MTLPADPRVARAIEAERLRLHLQATPGSVAASTVAGCVVVAVLWPAGGQGRLLGWLAALLLVMGLRLLVRAGHRRAGQAGAGPAHRWLRAHRLAYLAHGLVWGALLPLLPPGLEPGDRDAAVMIIAAMAGGSLVTAAYDLRAAIAFVLPAVVPLFAMLLGLGAGLEPALAAAVALFLVMMAVAGRRAAAMMARQVQADLEAQQRFEEARRHGRDAEAARRALADEHSLLQQLVLGTAQGYWFIDPQGVSLDANPAMCELLGRPREAVVGRSVFDFFTGAERDTLDNALALRRLGRTGGYEIDIVRPDGTRLHCFNNATPVRDATGQPIGSIGLWTDLSARRRQEAELRTYERVTNSVDDVVSVIDADRRFRLVNDAWCRLTGLSREEAIGMAHGLNPLRLSTAERSAAMEACFATGKVSTVTSQVTLRGGREALLQTTFSPYRDGDAQDDAVRSVILVTRDITGQERDRAAAVASEEYLRRTLNATGDGIFATDARDPTQPVRFVNEQMLRMWGIAPERAATLSAAGILEATLPQMVDPQSQARHIADIVSRGAEDESRVPLNDGRVFHRRCQAALVNGQLLRVWSFRDVSAEERALRVLHDGEAEQRALLDAFPGYIARLDGHERLSYVNARLAQALLKEPSALLGLPVAQAVSPRLLQTLQGALPRAWAGERVVLEIELAEHAPAATVQLTVAAGVDPLQGQAVLYLFGLDVTERNRALEALATARDEAERANQAKSQFLSNMSHELRTPMNAIVGFAQLLRRDTRAALAPHQLGYVKQIQRGADHLLSLINELLDLGSIEAGRLVLQSSAVPVAPLVEDCLNLVRSLAQERDITLRPATGLPAGGGLAMQADPTRLRQVLLNLLGNAVKYSRQGGEVALSCQVHPEGIELAVRDSGRGLSADEQARLFQPFERLGAEHGPVEGTGIGLALSRRLVQAMGGQIGVHSSPGQGSTFWVRLPAALTLAPPAHESVFAPFELDALRHGESTALYIDDNAVNVLLMENLLEHVPGVRLLSATAAMAGLLLAQRERPRLILLDIHMPGMDGFEVLARLRADGRTAAIPVVAVSADARRSDIDAAMAAGFADYLTKPLDFDQLLDTVHRLLRTGSPTQPAALAPALP